MSEWEKVKFGQLYAEPSRNGLTRPSAVRGSGYRMAAMGEIFSSNFVGDMDMDRVQLNQRELNTMMLSEGDLLFARQSLILSGAGKCSIVTGLTEPTTFESHLIRVRLDQSKANPLFFMYQFQLAHSPIKSIVQQGVQAGIRGSDLAFIEVICPSKDIQDRVALTLSNYDSAIANCRRQIALLEEAAMRLYREWFKDGKGEKKRLGDVIDFDPPVKLPKGVKRFSVPMGALQVNSMVLDRNAFEITTGNSGSKFNNGDTLLARITPCLENGKTAFVFGVDEEGACGSTEFIVMRSKTLNPFAVYLLARTESFRKVAIASMSGADGRQRARKEVISNHEIFVPAAESIEKLGELCKPMFAQVETLQNQIYSFSEARDRLLPKLMKGEIAV
jgi:type I restriction enzyme S subunit